MAKYTGPFTGGYVNSGNTVSGILVSGSSFSGNISNSGTISGAATGISVVNSTITGAIIDSGIIAGTQVGISIDGGINGSTISGAATAIAITGPTFTGGINNAGTLSGTSKGIFVGGTNGGTANVSTFTGGITNSGTISGSNGTGIAVSRVTSFSDGITNSGAISDFDAIVVDNDQAFSGGITNSGTVTGANYGIDVVADQSFAGGITNSGDITAAVGIFVVNDQTVTGPIVNLANSTIAAFAAGIAVTSVGQFGTNAAGGGIVNAGTITVTGTYPSDVGILVGGHVPGATVSDFSGGITNTGTISTTGYADDIVVGGVGFALGVGVSTFSGGITNAGTLTAAGLGNGIVVGGTAYSYGNVTVETFAGDIVNSGAISVGGDGILVGGKVSLFGSPVYETALFSTYVSVGTFDGGITNSGTISAGGDAIVIGGPTSQFAGVGQFTGNIVNSPSSVGGTPVPGTGTITGDIDILLANVGTFTGNIVNSTGASLVAETGSAIEIGAKGPGLFAYNPTTGGLPFFPGILPVESFIGSIINNGTISFSEGPGTFLRAGIQIGTTYGFAVEMQTFSGGITNTGTISVTTTATTGVLADIFVSGVSHFSGGITNSGTLSAHSDRVGTSGSGIVLYYDQTVDGGITNSGAISANFGIGVVNVATFTGSIVNATTGTINAGVDGIDVVGPGFTNDSTFLGSIVNHGAITATRVGIEVNGVAQFGSPTDAGNISNTGTITAATGIYVRAAITSGQRVVDTTMFGSIIDSGDILATNRGIRIGGGVTISSTATAVDVTALTFTGGISNSGLLSAAADGIWINDVTTFSGGIVNATGGTISSGNIGIEVDLADGDTFTGGITNHGVITGAIDGILVIDSPPKETFLGGITNTGSITATSSNGIEVDAITVFGPSNGGGITNSGTIAAGNVGIGINHVATFYGGVTNTGTITGVIGIDLSLTAGISIFDSGVIDGTGGTAIELNPTSGTDTLTLAAGYAITGKVVGGGSDTLQLGGSSAASFDLSLVNSGGQYTGFTVFDVIGGTWTATGTGSNWDVEGGTFKVSGTADDTVISGGTMEVESGGSPGASITFSGTGGTLQIDGPNTANSNLLTGTTISGFVSGDMIDLAAIANVDGSHVDMNDTTDVLTVTEGSSTYTLDFAGNFTGDYFHLTTDGSGTLITENTTPCYCPGTLIRTPRGQKKIEKLKIGDKVITASGVARPIKWIGRRSYSGRFVMGRKDILPVCIKAGAIEDNVPKRDLWISPNHAMYFKDKHPDGVLIEAKALVNGVSIVQAESVESIEYFHIELETHDVITAEGALAESFIDDDSRFLFHNAGEYRALYPDTPNEVTRYCALRVQGGYEVEAVWRRLAARAGLASSGEETRAGKLRGYVDRITGECVTGWAQNLDHPEAPVCLDILVSGVLVGQVLANRYREDLKQAGMGSGRHSFAFTVPPELDFAPDEVEVRRSLDGVALELTIEAWRMLRQSSGRQRAA